MATDLSMDASIGEILRAGLEEARQPVFEPLPDVTVPEPDMDR